MKKRLFAIIFLTAVYIVNSCGLGICAPGPQRIISLGPSLTEQLYLLGVQDRLIGCTVYCNRPEDAKHKEKVGTVIDINIEKIVSLKPDLVITTALTNPKAVKKLKNLGIKVQELTLQENFKGLCEQYLLLAKIVGREILAKELITQAKARVEAVKKTVKNLPKPKVFVQVGANPLITVTDDFFVNDFIESAGGINIAAGAKTVLYSREEVIKRNPDIIFIVTMGITGEKEMEIWKKYDVLNAVKNNSMYIIDSDKVCSPTPESFVETLEEFVKMLHPTRIEPGK